MSAMRARITDAQIEEFLYARSADPDASLLVDILSAARVVPQGSAGLGMQPLPRRTVVLLAAAMLTALLIGGALAVGAGLLRLPWVPEHTDPDRFGILEPLYPCQSDLSESVLLDVTEVTEIGGPEGNLVANELTVYQDGLAISGPPIGWDEAGPRGTSLDGAWLQRSLSAQGVQRLPAAITQSLPNCRNFPLEGGRLWIQARPGPDPYSITLSDDSFDPRMPSLAQMAAVNALVERLEDPSLGLPPDDWSDEKWEPYLPERWRIIVEFTRLGREAPDLSPSDGIVLPDESTLRTFGSELAFDPQDTYALQSRLMMVRCGITGLADARAIAGSLTAGGGQKSALGEEPIWYFGDSQAGVHRRIQVEITGLRPHEPDCVGVTPPFAEPTEPAGEPAALDGACDQVRSGYDYPSSDSTGSNPRYSSDWALCRTDSHSMIFASRRPVPAVRAANQARVLFGDEGSYTEQFAGHDIFFNGCAGTSRQCPAAVAISVEPYFVVVVQPTASETTLRDVAHELIEAFEDAKE